MRFLIILLMLPLLSSFNAFAESSSTGGIRVIVQPQKTLNAPWFSDWLPTSQQVDELLSLLPNFIHERSESGALTTSIENYGMQFAGVTRKGKKLIYINAFCKLHGQSEQDLRKFIVLTLDGGGCYFNLTYDPSSKRFSNFQVNGQA